MKMKKFWFILTIAMFVFIGNNSAFGQLNTTYVWDYYNSQYPNTQPYGQYWRDAEKSLHNTENDNNMCWAAAASNLLDWGGWKVDNYYTADQIFDNFVAHWENDGQYCDAAVKWWFWGDEPDVGGLIPSDWVPYISGVEESGGNYFHDMQPSMFDYVIKHGIKYDDIHRDSENKNSFFDIYDMLSNGYGIALLIKNEDSTWPWNYKWHWINVWGIDVSYDNQGYYIPEALYVTDNNSRYTDQHTYELVRVPIHFTNGQWYCDSSSRYNGFWLDEAYGLKPNPYPDKWTYEFRYDYGDGDYYLGTVYANSCYDGYLGSVVNERGYKGKYKLISATEGWQDSNAFYGEVDITCYYDSSSNQTYWSSNSPNYLMGHGGNYLGSENGYIISDAGGPASTFFFGRSGSTFYEADASNYTKYDFTYHYDSTPGANGDADYYTGYVYAPVTGYDGYRLGYTQAVPGDENSLPGYYEITGATPVADHAGMAGQVYVTTYYDKESNYSFIPNLIKNDHPAGSSYLGSEQDYLFWGTSSTPDPQWLFGKSGTTFYEADVSGVSRYSFTHYYNRQPGDTDDPDTHDYYTGYVYAWTGFYRDNTDYPDYMHDENNEYGFYAIGESTDLGTDLSSIYKLKQVYVTKYHDGETGNDYTPIVGSNQPNFLPFGQNLLGSELGYILLHQDPLAPEQKVYAFSRGLEADAADYSRYDFVYSYNNNSQDYYYGYVYALTEYAPHGWNSFYPNAGCYGLAYWEHNPNGGPGVYSITGVTHVGSDGSKAGQVYVTSYHDGMSGDTYEPVNPDTAKGTGNLGSESGYLVREGVKQLHFGYSQDYYGYVHFEDVDVDFSRYDFTYESSNGSVSYSGCVYAPTEYYDTTKWYYLENQSGHYHFTGVTSVGADSSKLGQVYVDQYDYRYYTNLSFTPVHQGTAVGTDLLGSEHDYIIQEGVDQWFFGYDSTDTFRTATPGDVRRYDFTYNYDNDADYYTGYVYAFNNEYHYNDTIPITYIDANVTGRLGSYHITHISAQDNNNEVFSGNANLGQVYVTGYHDSQSGSDFGGASQPPLVVTGGSNYLGSESGYIFQSGVTEWKFGNDGGFFYEVDNRPVNLYDFTYYYNLTPEYPPTSLSHDYYTGQVYAFSGYYDVGYILRLIDENGHWGYYKIDGVAEANTQDVSNGSAQLGQVDVTAYYDFKDSTFTPYTPVSGGIAAGSHYLGTEHGYIIESDVPEFLFGRGDDDRFYEARGGFTRFDFTCFYNERQGDRYFGYVYADSDYYHEGQEFSFVDENGATGVYEIIGGREVFNSSASPGQVYVMEYLDTESGERFIPVNSDAPLGSNYLGSESGYIIQEGLPEGKFGYNDTSPRHLVLYEADLPSVNRFDFNCFYNDQQGDSYKGYVYAFSGYYHEGDKFSFVDEHGKSGGYVILGSEPTEEVWNSAKLGEVYVRDYFDRESGESFIPVNSDAPLGRNYLGSEYGFIIQAGEWVTSRDHSGNYDTFLSDPYDWMFGHYPDSNPGEYWMEANKGSVDRYNFAYYYDVYNFQDYINHKVDQINCDYYEGYLYAPTDVYGNDAGGGCYYYIESEKGNLGVYTITSIEHDNQDVFDGSARLWEVYVTNYYDAQSDQFFTPLHSGVPAGDQDLGSEHGFIIQGGLYPYLFGEGGGTFFEADVGTYAYSGIFTYNNSDSYTFTVYALPEQGYAIGDEIDTGYGTYKITAVALDAYGQPQTYDSNMANKVFVDKYINDNYDGTFTEYPTASQGLTAVGFGGLGTEHDYLIKAGVPEYQFGNDESGNFLEVSDPATFCYEYTFTYTYGNGSGDYYTGTVYGEPGSPPEGLGYAVGSGFLAAEGPTAEALWGRVIVTSYHDGESNQDFTPVSGNPWGRYGLGSEAGFIVNSGIIDYYFGNWGMFNREADVVAYAYPFTYTYGDGSGDYYKGTVYAAPENAPTAPEGYTVAEGIRAAEGVAAEALWGKVEVASYYDGESTQTYANAGTDLLVTPGANNLGSESGYIIKSGVDDFYFGGAGHAEADLVGLYTYTFTYGCGDYYTGTVYASQDSVHNGLTYTDGNKSKPAIDENGQLSYYQITGVSYVEDTKYGQVTVASYHDSEKKQDYAPTFSFGGKDYLGSEYGFIYTTTYPNNNNWTVNKLANPILPDGTLKLYFGGGFWEADIKADTATK